MNVFLRNPHSVLAALKQRPQSINRITLYSENPPEIWKSVLREAEKFKIPITEEKKLNPQKDSKKEGRASFFEAEVSSKESVPLENLFKKKTSSKHGLWLALDCIQDPQNIGAIFRTAAFFDIEGIILTEERSASITSTVYDVASGGLEYIPFSIQTNLQRALQSAKDQGLWILGTSENAEIPLNEIPKDRSWLLVLGNEEKGLRRLTLDNCDMVCKIIPKGKIQTLNVSVAAGVLISYFH